MVALSAPPDLRSNRQARSELLVDADFAPVAQGI